MREIKNKLYRISLYGVLGRSPIVECDNFEELVKRVIDYERKGCIVTNVVELDITATSVRTPKVAIKSSPLYKRFLREL